MVKYHPPHLWRLKNPGLTRKSGRAAAVPQDMAESRARGEQEQALVV